MGNQPKTTIEINGLRYDAHTGKPLTLHKLAPVTAHHQPVKHPSSFTDIKRPTAAASKVIHKTSERGMTLMRHAVKKPTPAPRLKSASAMMDGIQPLNSIKLPRPSLHHPQEAEREKRAKQINRSSLVSKFTDVMQKPVNLPQHHLKHLDRPVATKVQPLAVKPHPASTPLAASTPAVVQAPATLTHAQSLLAKGLQNANSHLEKPVKPKSRARKHARALSFGAGSIAVLLLGAFFLWQNVPNINMRYAATRAGVHGSIPTYHPSGFAITDSVEYTPGSVTVSFRSNSDERSYGITQKNSSWNSETLMSNFVASASDSVQRYEDKGRTIYLYGDSNATWVNGGVWYNLTGASKLTSDQLIKIATSM